MILHLALFWSSLCLTLPHYGMNLILSRHDFYATRAWFLASRGPDSSSVWPHSGPHYGLTLVPTASSHFYI